MRRNRKGFTLVEIMIVVAIIALLAAIAIPNLLRAKISANDAKAKSQLKTLSTAAETYASANNGQYPTAIASLTNATPPYVSFNDCGSGSLVDGFSYTCNFTASDYTVTATVGTAGKTGTTHLNITTGGVTSW